MVVHLVARANSLASLTVINLFKRASSAGSALTPKNSSRSLIRLVKWK